MLKFLFLLGPLLGYSNPFPQEYMIDKDDEFTKNFFSLSKVYQSQAMGLPVLRVQTKWTRNSETKKENFELIGVTRENSGTLFMAQSKIQRPTLGSYIGVLNCGGRKLYDAIGTGSAFRKLTPAMSFRFPINKDVKGVCYFDLVAENPVSGNMEVVLKRKLNSSKVRSLKKRKVEVALIKRSIKSKKLYVNIYAEGYKESRRDIFFQRAKKVVEKLQSISLPGFEYLEFNAVFAHSERKLGKAKVLESGKIPKINSFLGLYFPYWAKEVVKRWYHIIYPTNDTQFRDGLAQAPYDYPIVLVDDAQYWGIGNYKLMTAIPAESSKFSYLLYHELGHFFGLNEEYDGGGPTELQFAPEIVKPWSQNLTFSSKEDGSINRDNLKWVNLLHSNAKSLPTSQFFWRANYERGKAWPVGVYAGGYADSEPRRRSFIPVKMGVCIMHSGSKFCPVCSKGIQDVIGFDLGFLHRHH